MEEIQKTEVRQQTTPTTDGVVRTKSVKSDQTESGALLAQRIIYFVGGAILIILTLRFVLLLLGASQASGFVDFIYSLSGGFVAPFNGIFTKPTYGNSTFDSATLVAMVVYAIIMLAAGNLVTLNKKERE